MKKVSFRNKLHQSLRPNNFNGNAQGFCNVIEVGAGERSNRTTEDPLQIVRSSGLALQ